MSTKALCKLLTLSCVFAALVAGARAGDVDVSAPRDMGDGTLRITVEAKTAFNRDVDGMKDTARAAAASFCDAQHKQLQVVSVSGKKPWFSTGFTSATIIFKAIDPNAPEPAPQYAAGPAAAAPVNIVAATDDLYAALMKLDDLRKKGILTDEEFQAEKKKILSHSN